MLDFKVAKFLPKVAQNNHRSYVFQNRPKSHQILCVLLKEYLSPRASKNLVTLLLVHPNLREESSCSTVASEDAHGQREAELVTLWLNPAAVTEGSTPGQVCQDEIVGSGNALNVTAIDSNSDLQDLIDLL